jgi:hypothetical protein
LDADDQLIHQIATNAADYAVGAFGMHLDKHRQLRLWKRYYDSALSSLITFQGLQRSHRTRGLAEASVN